MVAENKDGEVNSKELYALYIKFCSDEGIKDVMNNINFGKEVKKKFPLTEKKKLTRAGNREYYYLGIELSY
ncbi:primase-like DNA-binding domain-containing protein [Clostridium beijerinckii]|nr:primase-like DNA-binding domain-containing protein [Clostridium beijerinckii]